jgi:hypothetical protein
VATSEIVICHMALRQLGSNETITDGGDGTIAGSTDTGKLKRLCEEFYAHCRDTLLSEMHPTFARKFATLVQADDGTGEIWADEWDYAYTYPADSLILRRFVNDVGVGVYGWGEAYDSGRWVALGQRDYAWRYVVRHHDGAKVILADVDSADADMEYTERVTDTTRFTAPFDEALYLELAAKLARPLNRSDRLVEIQRDAYRAKRMAMALMSNEEAPRDRDVSKYHAARGGD